jgi:hypothetical protein
MELILLPGPVLVFCHDLSSNHQLQERNFLSDHHAGLFPDNLIDLFG